MIERKQQTATRRYDFRNEHSRVTGISNNAVLQKCHPSFQPKRSGVKKSLAIEIIQRSLDFARHDKVYGAILLGNVGRLFAATMNAIPIAIRKNEKNCPRVKGPINVASGSRKFSTTKFCDGARSKV